ncbi:hypothetical protein PAMP_017473 [Pampus punctatissimus]
MGDGNDSDYRLHFDWSLIRKLRDLFTVWRVAARQSRCKCQTTEKCPWSTLCVDLVSLTGELFKDTRFLTLDGITLFATCKVRRIFTMKTEPTGMPDNDMFLSGAGLMDLIPRSCQFPADVNHVTQVLNMENLQKAYMKSEYMNSDCVPDQTATARSASYQKNRTQVLLHTASGSRGSGPTPQTGRKSSVASDGMDRSALCIQNTGPLSNKIDQNITTENQRIANLTEELSIEEPFHLLHEGTPGRLWPHPPKERVFDKLGSKKLRVYSAGIERLASSAPPDAVSAGHSKRSKTREKLPPSRQESRQQPLTLTGKTDHLTADGCRFSTLKKSSRGADTPAVTFSCSIRPGLSSDLQVWSSWESNEGPDPQLSLQEEVFIFSSQPHSPKRGQGQGDQEKMEMGDFQVQSKSVRWYEAQPEDDFNGSESDEDQTMCVQSNPATPTSSDLTSDVQLEVEPEYHKTHQTSPEELSYSATNIDIQRPSSTKAEPARMVPKRCLSPSGCRQDHKCGPHGPEVVSHVLDGTSSVSLCRRHLQEIKLGDSRQHKGKEDNIQNPVDSSACDLHLINNLQMHGDDDDEELRMLASLKREQEEDECRASGFSASQIHQCNVSISMSSDDASTWTHISMPSNQGHHYQKEMNPLLCSNPREWMDVLSPPIMPPSQQRRSDNTGNHRGDESANEEENEYLNLLYDPCLNCYFDPKTGKYYELA